jgi:hypothetical protein
MIVNERSGSDCEVSQFHPSFRDHPLTRRLSRHSGAHSSAARSAVRRMRARNPKSLCWLESTDSVRSRGYRGYAFRARVSRPAAADLDARPGMTGGSLLPHGAFGFRLQDRSDLLHVAQRALEVTAQRFGGFFVPLLLEQIEDLQMLAAMLPVAAAVEHRAV